METKHTKGEWIMENPDNRKANFVIYATEKPIGIANVYEGDEAQANAKLIAAAPEMLKAIIKAKEMMETVRKYMPKSIKNSDRYEFENANAAIGNAIYKATK